MSAQIAGEVKSVLTSPALFWAACHRGVGELLGYEGGAAQQVIHRWEAGTREPGAVSLARWAEALGMSLKVAPNS